MSDPMTPPVPAEAVARLNRALDKYDDGDIYARLGYEREGD